MYDVFFRNQNVSAKKREIVYAGKIVAPAVRNALYPNQQRIARVRKVFYLGKIYLAEVGRLFYSGKACVAGVRHRFYLGKPAMRGPGHLFYPGKRHFAVAGDAPDVDQSAGMGAIGYDLPFAITYIFCSFAHCLI